MNFKLAMMGAAVLCTGAVPFAASAAQNSMMMHGMMKTTTVTFHAQNGSGETGTATLTPVGSKTRVVVALTGAPATAQPAHIHKGTCSKLNPAPLYPLTSVVNGRSTTLVPASVTNLMSSAFAINVHQSANNIAKYVSCGNIPSMKSSAMMHPAMMHKAMGTGAMGGGSMHSGAMGGGAMSSAAPSAGGAMNGGSMNGGSMSSAMPSTGGAMSSSAPSTMSSPMGPGSSGGTMVGPSAGPMSSSPASAASHSP